VPDFTRHDPRPGRRPSVAAAHGATVLTDRDLGAQHVGQVQSLLDTRVLPDVDPYTYFVAVLQCIDRHPGRKSSNSRRACGNSTSRTPLRSLLYRAPP
jgi:hypothetical protein